MDIVIIFAPDFPDLAKQFVSLSRQKLEIIPQDHDIYPLVLQDNALCVNHAQWNFVCLNVEHCFADNFAKTLGQLSKDHEIYMFAINTAAEGLWFERYQAGKLTRQWMEVEFAIEGNMGEYLPAEVALGYPFIDESYEDVGQEMLYELIYEITGFDITETF